MASYFPLLCTVYEEFAATFDHVCCHCHWRIPGILSATFSILGMSLDMSLGTNNAHIHIDVILLCGYIIQMRSCGNCSRPSSCFNLCDFSHNKYSLFLQVLDLLLCEFTIGQL
jgi:hypothetical protein